MHILLLISSNGYYGAEGVVVLLASQLVRSGHRVTLGLFNATEPCSEQLRQEAIARNLYLLDLPCHGRFDLETISCLKRYIERTHVDVVHAHGYKADLYGFLATRWFPVALVATCHNWTGRTRTLRHYATLDKSLLIRFDAVVAVSQNVFAVLRDARVRPGKLFLIRNGIDTHAFTNRSDEEPDAPPASLGVLSRLSSEKGVDVLLRAMPLILERYPNLQCVVAGTGPERESLLALAVQLGIADNLQLQGFCADTASFLAQHSIVVHPSRIDGMPLAVLEAMAAGKPIVASAVGDIPAMLAEGNAGLLVAPDDPAALAAAILRLADDPALRTRLGSNARDRVCIHYDAVSMAEAYLELYRSVRQPHPTQRRSRITANRRSTAHASDDFASTTDTRS